MTYTSKTAKQLRQKSGTLLKKLATEFGLIQDEYDTEVASGLTAIDLSGSGVTVNVFVADRAYTLSAAYLAFTEASSADTGKTVSVGKVFVGTDDSDFFVTAVATEASKETGYRQELTLVKTAIAEGDIITVTSEGGKAGTGAVIPQLYLTRA